MGSFLESPLAFMAFMALALFWVAFMTFLAKLALARVVAMVRGFCTWAFLGAMAVEGEMEALTSLALEMACHKKIYT